MVLNFLYGCIGTTAFSVVLCHLFNMFCLPILLYKLEVYVSEIESIYIQHGK